MLVHKVCHCSELAILHRAIVVIIRLYTLAINREIDSFSQGHYQNVATESNRNTRYSPLWISRCLPHFATITKLAQQILYHWFWVLVQLNLDTLASSIKSIP